MGTDHQADQGRPRDPSIGKPDKPHSTAAPLFRHGQLCRDRPSRYSYARKETILATKAKCSQNSRHLKRRASALARRLKRGDFPEAWYAGQHFSAEDQKVQVQADLTKLQNDLAALAAPKAKPPRPTEAPR